MAKSIECPDCNGKGSWFEDHYVWIARGEVESRADIKFCELCEGIGWVVEESTWIPKQTPRCSNCRGSGTVEESYVTERYPSGLPARYGTKKVTCRKCNGYGYIAIGGYYKTWYRPDYDARQ